MGVVVAVAASNVAVVMVAAAVTVAVAPAIVSVAVTAIGTTSATSVEVDMVAVASGVMRIAAATVTHSGTTQTSVPYGATMRVEACVVVVAAVSATIGNIYCGMAVVEVPAVVVAVDGEVPAASPPQDGAEEIVGCIEQAVLPVVQDATQVVQAIVVVHAGNVGG